MTDEPPKPIELCPSKDSLQGANAGEKAITAMAGMLECRELIREAIRDLKTQKSS